MCFNGTNTRFYRKTDNVANMLFLVIFSSSENQFTRTNKILLRYPKKKLFKPLIQRNTKTQLGLILVNRQSATLFHFSTNLRHCLLCLLNQIQPTK